MSTSMEYYRSRLKVICLQKASFLLRWFLLPFAWLAALNTRKLRTSRQSDTLRKSIEDSLQVTTYDELATAAAAEEMCAVCLSEMHGRDRVWELRNCNHVFHKGCLDTWLDHDENSTCPLCRAPLVVQAQAEWSSVASASEPSWAVDRLLYLFGDELLLS